MRAVRNIPRGVWVLLSAMVLLVVAGMWSATIAPRGEIAADRAAEIADDSPPLVHFAESSPQTLAEPLPDGTGVCLGALRLWHVGDDSNKEILFLPDSKTLVSGTQNLIRYWDATTGKLLRESSPNRQQGQLMGAAVLQNRRIGPPGGVYSQSGMRLVPDGRRVAVLGSTSFAGAPNLQREPVWDVRFWDEATGEMESVIEWTQKFDEFDDFQFTPDGSTLFVGDSRGNVHAWDLKTRKETSTTRICNGSIANLAISPDGKQVAVSTMSSGLFVWNWRSGEPPVEINERWPRRGLAYSPDGKHLAVIASSFREIHVWNVASRKMELTLRDNRASEIRLESPLFLPNGKAIVAANRAPTADRTDPAVLVWDTTSGKLTRRFPSRGMIASKLALSPDGKLLAVTSSNPQIRLWNLSTGKLQADGTDSGHVAPVNFLAFLPDSENLLASSQDGACKIWHATTGNVVRDFASTGQQYRALAVSPDGRLVAASTMDDVIHIRDLRLDRDLPSLKGHGHRRGSHNSLAFSPDGSVLTSWGEGDLMLRRWNLKTGEMLSETKLVESTMSATLRDYLDPTGVWSNSIPKLVSAGILPDGKNLFLVARGSYWIFDTATGQQDSEWNCPFPASSMAISPDGTRMFLAGSSRGAVPNRELCHACAIDLRTDQILWIRDFTGWSCKGVTVSPDGKLVATAVYLRNQNPTPFPEVVMQILDAATGEVLQTATASPLVRGSVEQVYATGDAIAFSPDGRKLAFAQQDKSLVIWDLEKLRMGETP